MTNEFNDAVMAHFVGDNEAVAVENLKEYLASFTGRLFERLADPDPFSLTANDFVAVSALSVEVPPEAAGRLLGELHPTVGQLLRAIPVGASIADTPELLAESEAAWELYELLRSIHGLGPTTVSKLMAAKRPALVPIRDSVVWSALGEPELWWAPWVEFTTGGDAEQRLAQVRSVAQLADADHLTLLRVIDVVIWMRHRRQSFSPSAP